jgi:probable addiction module antidote protein
LYIDRILGFEWKRAHAATYLLTYRAGTLASHAEDGSIVLRKPDDQTALPAQLPERIMTKLNTHEYDVAERLRTPEEMALYLDACIEESDGDAAFIAKALGDIARAKDMTQVAKDAGLSRESLYKALSGERSPDFSTILKVSRALGLRLHAVPASDDARAEPVATV